MDSMIKKIERYLNRQEESSRENSQREGRKRKKPKYGRSVFAILCAAAMTMTTVAADLPAQAAVNRTSSYEGDATDEAYDENAGAVEGGSNASEAAGSTDANTEYGTDSGNASGDASGENTGSGENGGGDTSASGSNNDGQSANDAAQDQYSEQTTNEAASEENTEEAASYASGTLTYGTDDDAYKVTVTFDESTLLPEGTTLSAAEIPADNDQDQYDYDNYLAQAQNKLNEDNEKNNADAENIDAVHFYDILFTDADGNKVEPDPNANLQVSISYKDGLEKTKEQSVQIFHFTDDNDTSTDKIDLLANPELTGDDTNVKVDEVKFDADQFSVYAVALTSPVKTEEEDAAEEVADTENGEAADYAKTEETAGAAETAAETSTSASEAQDQEASEDQTSNSDEKAVAADTAGTVQESSAVEATETESSSEPLEENSADEDATVSGTESAAESTTQLSEGNDDNDGVENKSFLKTIVDGVKDLFGFSTPSYKSISGDQIAAEGTYASYFTVAKYKNGKYKKNYTGILYVEVSSDGKIAGLYYYGDKSSKIQPVLSSSGYIGLDASISAIQNASVDAVSSASLSTGGSSSVSSYGTSYVMDLKTSIINAIRGADPASGSSSGTTLTGVADGTYRGTAKNSSSTEENQITVDVTVKDGKITSVTVVSGTDDSGNAYTVGSWDSLVSAVQSEVVDTTANKDNIDAVSSATTNGWKGAIQQAIKNALGSTATSSATTEVSSSYINVRVAWKNSSDATDSVTVRLSAVGETSKDVTLSSSNSWSAQATGLNANKTYTYRIQSMTDGSSDVKDSYSYDGVTSSDGHTLTLTLTKKAADGTITYASGQTYTSSQTSGTYENKTVIAEADTDVTFSGTTFTDSDLNFDKDALIKIGSGGLKERFTVSDYGSGLSAYGVTISGNGYSGKVGDSFSATIPMGQMITQGGSLASVSNVHAQVSSKSSWLTARVSGTNVILSGTPTEAGTFPLATLTAQAGGNTFVVPLYIVVDKADETPVEDPEDPNANDTMKLDKYATSTGSNSWDLTLTAYAVGHRTSSQDPQTESYESYSDTRLAGDELVTLLNNGTEIYYLSDGTYHKLAVGSNSHSSWTWFVDANTNEALFNGAARTYLTNYSGYVSGNLYTKSTTSSAKRRNAPLKAEYSGYTVKVGETLTITGTSGYDSGLGESYNGSWSVTNGTGSATITSSTDGANGSCTIKGGSAGTVTVTHTYYAEYMDSLGGNQSSDTYNVTVSGSSSGDDDDNKGTTGSGNITSSVNMGSSSYMVDRISDKFNLTDDATATAIVQEWNGTDWVDTENTLDATIDRTNKLVYVTGFDYASNAYVSDWTSTDTTTPKRVKLTISGITGIQTTATQTNVATNGTSGMYSSSSYSGTPDYSFTSPTVNIPGQSTTSQDASKTAGGINTTKIADKQGQEVSVGDDVNLTLEAQATGSTVNVPGEDSDPVDILLVLDRTASMTTSFDGSTRLAALKTAATTFLENLSANDDSRIALVTFGEHSWNGGYTLVTTDLSWTSLTSGTISSLKTTINGLSVSNLTDGYDTDYVAPLNTAASLINSSSNDNKYVVFFSDGDANYNSLTEVQNAVSPIKSKATVYSIACGNFSNQSKINAVASSGQATMASSIDELKGAFQSAATTISKSTSNTSLDKNSIFKDVINTDKFDVSNATATVTVYDYDNNTWSPLSNASATTDGTTEGTLNTWTNKASDDGTLTINLNKSTGTVTVTGFSYKDHYLPSSGEEATSPTKVEAQKLHIEINGLKVKDSAQTTSLQTVHTNKDEQSGIFEKSDSTDSVVTLPQPTVNIPAQVESTSDLTVKEVVAGTNADTSREFSFTATVTPSGGTASTQTFTLDHNGTYTLRNVPVGASVVITQTSDSDYPLTSIDDDSLGGTGTVADLKYELTTTSTSGMVTFTNTRSEATPITVTKVWGTGVNPADGTTVTFSITGTNFSTSVDLTAGNNWSAVIAGTDSTKEYTVTETGVKDKDEKDIKSDYTASNAVKSGGTDETPAATYTITNTSATKTTSLTVKKVVGDDSPDTTKEFSFSAVVTPSGGSAGDPTTFSLKHNGTYELTNIPVGASVAITETPADGYYLSQIDQSDGLDGDVNFTEGKYTVTVPENGGTVTFTNETSPNVPDAETGNDSVTVHKTVSAGDNDNEFNVNLAIDTKTNIATYLTNYFTTTATFGATEPPNKSLTLGSVQNLSDLGGNAGITVGTSSSSGSYSGTFDIYDSTGQHVLVKGLKLYWSQANNITFYATLPGTNQVMILATGVKKNTNIANKAINLSTDAETIIKNAITSSTTNVTLKYVTDVMGDYIIYQDSAAENGISNPSNVSYNESTKTLTWNKPNKSSTATTTLVSESTSGGSTVQVYETANYATLSYKVKLDVDKSGFENATSGGTTLNGYHTGNTVGSGKTNGAIATKDGESTTVSGKWYNTNDHATLTYRTTGDTSDQTIDFPTPLVQGTKEDVPLTAINHAHDGRVILWTILGLAALAGGGVYMRRRKRRKEA